MRNTLQEPMISRSLTREELEEEFTWEDETGRLRDRKGRFVQEWEELRNNQSLSRLESGVESFRPTKWGRENTLYRTRVLSTAEKEILWILGTVTVVGIIGRILG